MDDEVGGEVGLEGCAADGEDATDEGVGDEEAGEVGEAVPADGEADAGDGEGDGVEGVEHGSSVPLMVVGLLASWLAFALFLAGLLELEGIGVGFFGTGGLLAGFGGFAGFGVAGFGFLVGGFVVVFAGGDDGEFELAFGEVDGGDADGEAVADGDGFTRALGDESAGLAVEGPAF